MGTTDTSTNAEQPDDGCAADQELKNKGTNSRNKKDRPGDFIVFSY
jgi:hypothetical protein